MKWSWRSVIAEASTFVRPFCCSFGLPFFLGLHGDHHASLVSLAHPLLAIMASLAFMHFVARYSMLAMVFESFLYTENKNSPNRSPWWRLWPVLYRWLHRLVVPPCWIRWRTTLGSHRLVAWHSGGLPRSLVPLTSNEMCDKEPIQFLNVRLNLFNHLIGFIPCQICLYFSI